MITKERLEELIQQETIIYCSFYSKYAPYVRIGKWKLNNKMYVDDGVLYLEDCDDGEILYLTDIFENEEDANWHKEFGCIERAERLELPTWEEIDKEYNKSKYKRKKFGTYEIVKFVGKKTENDYVLEIFVDNYTKKFIGLSCFVRQPLTKENYTLACRKAKELFLGENK